MTRRSTGFFFNLFLLIYYSVEYFDVRSALLLLDADEWARLTVVLVGFDTHCYAAKQMKNNYDQVESILRKCYSLNMMNL